MDNADARAPRSWLARRLSRETTSGRFIPEVDGLRFPAIAIVVIGHLAAEFTATRGYPAARQWGDAVVQFPAVFSPAGVLLFFIISGFVLALPFVRQHQLGAEPVSLRAYFSRRLTRLEPPYLLSLTGLLFLELAAQHLHVAPGAAGSRELVRHYFVSAAYLHNLVYGTASIVNGPAWSLEIEVQFYVLVPLLALVFRIRPAAMRRAVMVAGALAAMLLQRVVIHGSDRLSLSVLAYLQFFLIGFLLADLYLLSPLVFGRTRGGFWDAVAAVGWPLLFAAWLTPTATIAVPCLGALLFVAAFRGNVTRRVFSNRWIVTIGGMCYSIYLLHFMLISAMGRALFAVWPSSGVLWLDAVERTPLLLGVPLVVCAAFFVLIERPCMDRRWPSRLAARIRALWAATIRSMSGFRAPAQ
jgi:peptidoglycan/LPS O-acetylase OafA/YrhL